MWYLDDWHDCVRVLTLSVAIYCLVKLTIAYKKESHTWNLKTRDYWFSFVMWCLAAATMNVQAILLDRPFSPAFVLLTAAIAVSGKGLHKFGSWGTESAEKLQ